LPWVRDHVAGVIGISPALTPRNPAYFGMKWLVGLAPPALSEFMLTVVAGKVRNLAAKPLPAKVIEVEWRHMWTIVYPSISLRGLIELYLTVELTISRQDIRAPLLAVANELDPVVDFASTRRFFGAEHTVSLTPPVGEEHQHCITGRVTAASTIELVVGRAIAFARSL